MPGGKLDLRASIVSPDGTRRFERVGAGRLIHGEQSHGAAIHAREHVIADSAELDPRHTLTRTSAPLLADRRMMSPNSSVVFSRPGACTVNWKSGNSPAEARRQPPTV